MYNCGYNRRPTIRLIQRRALPQRRYGNFIDCKTTKGLIVSSVCDAFESWEGRRLISAAPAAQKRPLARHAPRIHTCRDGDGDGGGPT